MSNEYKAGDVVVLKPLNEIPDRSNWVVTPMTERFGKSVKITLIDENWQSFRINGDYEWSLSWIKSRIDDDLIIN